MENDLRRRQIFANIKDDCIYVSRRSMVPQNSFDLNDPALNNALANLYSKLKAIEDPQDILDSNFGDYVFMPLSHLLNKEKLGDRTLELVVDIAGFLISNCWKRTFSRQLATQFLSLLTYLSFGPPPSLHGKDLVTPQFNEKSDQLKRAGCDALCDLYDAVSSAKLEKILTDMPTIAYNITLFLESLKTGSKLIDLQISALKALDLVLFTIIRHSDDLIPVLPGVVSNMTKLVTGKFFKVNYVVIVPAIKLLDSLLTRVYNDSDIMVSTDSDIMASSILSKEKDSSNDSPSGLPIQLSNKRNSSWLKATKEQVRIALSTILLLRTHNRPEVQAEILHLSLSLLNHSIQCLDSSVPILLDTALFFVGNPSNEFHDIANASLKSIIATSSKAAKTALEDRTRSLIESLPRVMSSPDEIKPIHTLNAIQGSITTLKNPRVLTNVLIDILLDSLNFKALPRILPSSQALADPVNSLKDVSVSDFNSLLSLSDLSINGELSSKSQLAVQTLLTCIGQSEQGISVMNTLLDRIEDSTLGTDFSMILTWTATYVLRGLLSRSRTDNLEDYLTISADENSKYVESVSLVIPDCLSLYQRTIRDASSARNLRTYQTDSLSCIALYGLSLISLYQGEALKDDMIDILYPVVELLGYDNSLVVKSAQHTLVNFACHSGYPSVQSLLLANADYLVDEISIKLNILDFSPQTPIFLSTLIKLGGESLVTYMDDLVTSIFIILDNYHQYTKLVSGMFGVFRVLVEEMKKKYQVLFLEEYRSQKSDDQNYLHISSIDSLLTELDRVVEAPVLKDETEDLKKEQISSNIDETGYSELNPSLDSSMDNTDEVDLKEWKYPISKSSYTLLTKIIGYAEIYLTHSSPNLRYNLIVTIDMSLDILFISEDQFLPVINSFWPIMVSRLEDDEVFVVEATLKCIGNVCFHGKNFMTSRLTKLWPKLKKLLPTKTRVPPLSFEARIMQAVFSCLSKIVTSCQLSEEIFDDILQTVSPYFATNDSSSDLKDSFEKSNSDMLWLTMALMDPSSNQNIEIPTSSLTNFAFSPIVL